MEQELEEQKNEQSYLKIRAGLADARAQSVKVKLETKVDEAEDLEKCIACCEKPRNVLLNPCGHLVLCSDCLKGCKGICPMCNEPYGEAVISKRIFLT